MKTMKHTKAQALLSLLLAAALALGTLFSAAPAAFAASVDTRYPTKSMTGYILSTGNRTAVAYSSIGGSSVGYIYANDNCTIQAVYTNGWVKAVVPWSGYSNGRVVYTKLSYFLNTTYTPAVKTCQVKSPAYSRSNLSTRLGYAYAGDQCYIVNASGSYYQVLCPWTGGVYRICWVSQSAFGHTHTYYSGYEAAHPHKVFMKCSVCQAYYYTGETKKLSGCGTCYPSVSVTGYVNTSSLPLVLRKTASSGSASLARMPRGSVLTVLDNKAATNGFYHVKYGSLTGYASAGYITFTKPSQTSALLWPAAAKQVTCMYYYKTGAKHSTRYGYRNALDIAGGGNIYAAAAGKVETATYQSGGFGRYVVILHNDGTRTLYGHLNSLSVKAGDYVSQGQTIGVMGSTGNSSGTHLHFEWSGGDPWNTYFKSNTGLIYEANVRANNAKFNADKTIVNYLDTYYRYSNGWYYRK